MLTKIMDVNLTGIFWQSYDLFQHWSEGIEEMENVSDDEKNQIREAFNSVILCLRSLDILSSNGNRNSGYKRGEFFFKSLSTYKDRENNFVLKKNFEKDISSTEIRRNVGSEKKNENLSRQSGTKTSIVRYELRSRNGKSGNSNTTGSSSSNRIIIDV